MMNHDAADFGGDYTDVEGPQPRNHMHKNEVHKARLYNTWKDLCPMTGELIGTTIAEVGAAILYITNYL